MRLRILLPFAAPAILAACSTTNLPDAPKTIGQPAKPHYKIGAPYKIDGEWYVPQVDKAYDKVGTASWYGDAFHGKFTANGEIFDKSRLSAAHKTLPLPTIAEVENLENGRKVIVRINDRGPFVDDRVIDLSHAAADELGFTGKGLARVRVRYVGEADVMALAAKPGGTNAPLTHLAAAPEPQKKSRQSSKAPGRREANSPTPASAEADPIGDLIAGTAGASPPPRVAEIWVEIARIASLDDLARMNLGDAGLGPVSVQPDDQIGAGQSLRIGPFADETVATASLTRAQAAGFGAARIIRSAGR